MNKRGLVEIILLIVLVILVIGGGYLVLTKESSLQQPEQEQIQCNTGNFITLPTPFGVAGGPITGVETHELANEETKSLCCMEVETSDNIKIKVCEGRTEGDITHRIAWRFSEEKGEFVKFEELVPQFDTQCTYLYDSVGEFESRSCA